MAILKRPDRVDGTTYKIRPPVIDEAVYITINDSVVDGELRPIELFINSKDMQNFQWVSCVTRLVSAELRRTGPFPEFVIDELIETYDPKGGYFVPGTNERADSIVSHIGFVLRDHCIKLGLMKEKEDGEEKDAL